MNKKQNFLSKKPNTEDISRERGVDIQLRLAAPRVSLRVQEIQWCGIRCHFGSSHFLFERARGFSLFTSFSGFVLSMCLQPTQFCSFSFSLMARVCDGTNVPMSPAPASSSNMGSPHGSLPDLEGTGFRASTMEKINEIYLQLPLVMQNAARIENCVQTLAQTVAAQTTKITSIEQLVGSFVARVTSLETNAAYGSSSPDSARSWNMLGQRNGSKATGSLVSHGPGSCDDSRNTRRRLDTFSSPEGEHARSAVLLRFPCEQYRTGITIWIDNLWENPTSQPTTNLSQFSAKQVPCRPDSYLKQEPNVRTFWPDFQKMVSPCEIKSLLLRQNNYHGAPIQIT